jgi:hypothetical protein
MTEQERTGSIIRIIGPVLDVRFQEGKEPALKTLLVTKTEPPVHIEVVQHHSPGVVRAIALEPTEGLPAALKWTYRRRIRFQSVKTYSVASSTARPPTDGSPDRRPAKGRSPGTAVVHAAAAIYHAV